MLWKTALDNFKSVLPEEQHNSYTALPEFQLHIVLL